MKFHKFRDLCRQYPWLINIVDPLGHMRHDVKTMSVQDGVTRELRLFVRNQLDYVAFRPWQQMPDIMLQAQGWYETSKTFEYAVRCDSYFGGSLESCYETEWEIVWRVGDGEFSSTLHRDGFTLNETMVEIHMDHAKGHFGEGELEFGFLVKRITESPRKKAPVRMSIEIYQVPFDDLLPGEFLPESAAISEYDFRARQAYFNDEPMPPIMPVAFA